MVVKITYVFVIKYYMYYASYFSTSGVPKTTSSSPRSGDRSLMTFCNLFICTHTSLFYSNQTE
jgi:hypothetical protein